MTPDRGGAAAATGGTLARMTDNADTTALRLERLDDIERRAQELIDAPHYVMHDGKPVLDPKTGEPLRDEEPLLKGLDIAIRVSDLRARILGLYAPHRHHLVDENGNTIDITKLIPLLRRAGIIGDDRDGE